MNLVLIEMEIEGTTPLICNRFTDAAAMSATAGTAITTVGDRGTPKEQAEAGLYISPSTGLEIIPNPNLFRCIIDAGTFFKAGRSKVTTQKSSLIPACVTVNQMEMEIVHKEPWEVDTRPVRIPATGGRILRHRPMFHDWSISFSVTLDVEVIGVKLFRQIMDAAGQKIGLGDFRPACKGPYGKFVIVKWVVDENGKAGLGTAALGQARTG